MTLALLLVAWPLGALGGDWDAPASEEPAPTPSIGLDQLLRPSGVPSAVPTERRPGGKGREAWQSDFARARGEVQELRDRVRDLQDEMRQKARVNWSYSPGGSADVEDPEMLKRKAKLKRDRQSLAAAERRLQDLEVEASLAGVPPEWTDPPTSEP